MLINNIELKNFRNYKEEIIEFDKDINVIYGDNAQGKTNILESIFIGAFGKSYRTSKDRELINKDENFANLLIRYENKDRSNKIEIKLLDDNKKSILLNGVKIKKLSDLLGKLNVVLFTPDDINILKDSPQYRRRFLDMMIGQIKPNYIYNLNLYKNVLEERNNYLKDSKYNKNEDLLEIYNKKLTDYAEIVYKYREEYINKIKTIISDIHSKITENKENIRIEYVSDFKNKEDFLKLLDKFKDNDYYRGFTTKGIHRDDFVIYINNEDVSTYGSQGQNRTVILTLKLCELNIIKEEIGENPVLLLDDFMSELDEKRRLNFLKNIDNIQVIITCTDKFEKEKFNFINIEKGKIKKES